MRCEETLNCSLPRVLIFFCVGSSKPSSSRTSLSWICKQNQRTLEHKLLMCKKSIAITHITQTNHAQYTNFADLGLVFPALIFHLPASHCKGRCCGSCIEYLQSQENVATVDVWYIPSGRPQKQMQADQIFATTHHSRL